MIRSFTHQKFFRLLLVIVFSFTIIAPIAKPSTANAVTGSDWKAGRIIDDGIFYNKDSMTAAQIQAFLDAKVPVCDRYRPSSNPTYQPPWTCLKEYQENTTTKANNIGQFNPDGSPKSVAGGKSAAQIIWEVSQTYGINPQVLIVMLQKEQSLVTDNWPWKVQYDKAMGYACPDTAPCDTQYYGFYNQVSSAAWQLKRYIQYPNNYNFKAGVTRYIQFSPDTSCGGSNVFIENAPTAALYNYTPYQPNAGALANLNGTSSCGAYGNRNFWRYFNDWFGPTLTSAYYWLPTSQTSYYDYLLSKPIDLNNAAPSTRYLVSIKVKNMGSAVWNKGQVFLGTSSPQNRESIFYDSTWVAKNRPSTIVENQVSPGEFATFNFWINTPAQTGKYKEYFNLLAENVTWMNDMGMYFDINVNTPRYTWQWQGQGQFTDASKTTSITSSSVANQRVYMTLRAKNTGNTTWQRNNIYIGTSLPNDRRSEMFDSSWTSRNRTTTFKEQFVFPGDTATFEFWSQLPSKGNGNIKEYFNLVSEGKSWFSDIGLYYQFTTPAPKFSWSPNTQSAFNDNTKSSSADLSNLTPGAKKYLSVRVQNTGNTIWKKGTVKLGTSLPNDRISKFYDTTWLSSNRTATILENQVNPGEYGTFEFYISAPSVKGTYKEYFNLLAENVTWMNDLGMYYQFTVK